MDSVTHTELDQRFDEHRREMYDIMDRKFAKMKGDFVKDADKTHDNLKTMIKIFISITLGFLSIGIVLIGWSMNGVVKRVDNFREDFRELRAEVKETGQGVAEIKGQLKNAEITSE